MKVSYNWLNKYFGEKLPEPDKVTEALTFHSWEIESIEKVGADTVLDVNVLPDKAMWGLSHRGIARDLATILNIPLEVDPLLKEVVLEPKTTEPLVEITSLVCRRFAAARITGIQVAPSPDWLREALEAIGQRSINNLVDASNYVMFDVGQPSHIFDADKIGGGLVVRQAKDGETLSALDELTYTFTNKDTVIASKDGHPLSIAGIKGGLDSGISDSTRNIVVEAANWNPLNVRKTATRLKLRSDASARYENGIVPEMVPHGLFAAVNLILEVAGGTLEGYEDTTREKTALQPVSVSLDKINSVLGVKLNAEAVSGILQRFDWQFSSDNGRFEIIPPFERTDLAIEEDLIEEIGRIYGYEHIEAVVPEPMPVAKVNKRFYYSEKIIEALTELGFSEIYTSSFREDDQVKMANAFASDKGYLRSSLLKNMRESLAKNASNADLLGLKQIKLFEIGNVFSKEGENMMLALGVQSPFGYKAKLDDPVLNSALEAVSKCLETAIGETGEREVVEVDLGAVINDLPTPTEYTLVSEPLNTTYKPFSVYPAIARDIAMWISSDENEEEIATLIRDKAGELCVRVTLFDRFEKEGRVSYAYRLVFQSKEKTLTDEEINAVMDGVYSAVSDRGYEVR